MQQSASRGLSTRAQVAAGVVFAKTRNDPMQQSALREHAVAAIAVRAEVAAGVVFAKRATTPRVKRPGACRMQQSASRGLSTRAQVAVGVVFAKTRNDPVQQSAFREHAVAAIAVRAEVAAGVVFAKRATTPRVKTEGMPLGQVREGVRDATVWHSDGRGYDRVGSVGAAHPHPGRCATRPWSALRGPSPQAGEVNRRNAQRPSRVKRRRACPMQRAAVGSRPAVCRRMYRL